MASHLLRFSETIENRRKMREQTTRLHLPQPAPHTTLASVL
jgi:hypothetical protein